MEAPREPGTDRRRLIRPAIRTRLDGDGRITISGRTFIRTENGSRTETALESDAELIAAYREHFGMALDRAVS